MTGESETVAALKRAGTRMAFHLLRAGVESLKALEALVDELGKIGRSEPTASEPRSKIEIETE